MPECIVTKDGTGKLVGLDETSRRRFEKFRRLVADLGPGESLMFSYKLPRSPEHHGFFFYRVTALLDRQESFESLEDLLTFLKVGAGFVDFMPGPSGQLVAVPKSIAWANLDEKEFTEVREAIWRFLWTKPAQQALWPHMTPGNRYAMVEQWMREAG